MSRKASKLWSPGSESVTSYIRRRRLERARYELTTPGAGLSIPELAARYHFADSSHFTRLFKKRFGHPPARWARLGEDPTVAPGAHTAAHDTEGTAP